MRTRLYQAVAFAAVLSASATVSSPVLSADLPPPPLPPAYAEPLPPENVFEGWYLGGTIGGATVSYDFSQANGSIDSNGILGGAIGGWSWQSGPVVIGLEGDILGADISGSRHFNAGANLASPDIGTMADLRLRAGYAITPRVLVFGTFGGAWANADLPITGPGGGGGSADVFGDLPVLSAAASCPVRGMVRQCTTGGTLIAPALHSRLCSSLGPQARGKRSRPKQTRMSRRFAPRQPIEIMSGLSQGLAARNARSISSAERAVSALGARKRSGTATRS